MATKNTFFFLLYVFSLHVKIKCFNEEIRRKKLTNIFILKIEKEKINCDISFYLT